METTAEQDVGLLESIADYCRRAGVAGHGEERVGHVVGQRPPVREVAVGVGLPDGDVQPEEVGRSRPVRAEETDDVGPPSGRRLRAGRAEHQAPEVDGECIVLEAEGLKRGDFVRCRVVDSEGVDLIVEVLGT